MYDVESIRKICAAAESDFRWFRFESNSIKFVLPATVECARQIASDPSSIEWLKMMGTNICPMELLSGDDGLVILLGGRGNVIPLAHNDDRPYSVGGEVRVVQLAGDPKTIIVNGRAETAEGLVEQFIFEKTGFRRWNDATGKFSVMARFDGIADGKVVLLDESGSKAYLSREQLGIADQDYIDEVMHRPPQ